MAKIEIESKAAAVIKKLKKLESVIEDSEPTLSEVGKDLAGRSRSRFYSGTSPTGKRWRPSKLARKRRRKTLVDTGYLRDSITSKIGSGEVAIGTDAWYGRIHQKGGTD